MRISDRMLTDNIRTDLQSSMQSMSVLQNELATGKRINLPSDDPSGTAMVMRYNADLANDNETQRIGQNVTGRLNAVDSSLSSLDDVLQRARELAVEAGTGTVSATDEQNIAAEVNQLANQAIQIGNSNFGGVYIFGGTQTTTAPFTAVGGQTPTSVTYNGNAAPITIALGQGSSVQVDAPGSQALQPAINALIALRDGLNSGDPQGAAGASVSAIDSALDNVQTQRGTIGARTDGLNALLSQVSDETTNLTAMQSNLADVDITDVTVRLQSAQNVYQAALGAAAKVITPSLADFLH